MMNVEQKHLTVADLDHMPNLSEHFELLHGVLIEMSPTKRKHGLVQNRIARLVSDHVEDNDLGEVVGAETGIRLNEDTMLAPDLAFTSHERIDEIDYGDDQNADSWLLAIPELIVEVASRSNTPAELEEKIELYFKAGVRLIWVVYPTLRKIHVYCPQKDIQILRETDTLTGDVVLPGFAVPVAEVFAPLNRRKAEPANSANPDDASNAKEPAHDDENQP